MATKKKLLQAAAGSAGGAAALNVEDVFSTYLYEGNGESQSIDNRINLGQSNDGGSAHFEPDDSSDTEEIALGSANYITSGDFTIECFVWIELLNSTNIYGYEIPTIFYIDSPRLSFTYDYVSPGGSADEAFNLYDTAYRYGSVNQHPESTYTNTWVHVAVVRNSGTIRCYVDGTEAFSFSNTTDYSGATLTIGGNSNGTPLQGHISNFRVVDGTAVYTSNFTPPTSELTAISGTTLLTFTSENTLTDTSSSSHAFTVTGSVSASNFGPFDAADAGEGGLVWIKGRTGSVSHALYDTERGANSLSLSSDDTGAAVEVAGYDFSSFNSNGFTVSARGGALHNFTNDSGREFASWTFRKAPKFFDVVTYTGTGVARTVSHNLGSVPATIIIKRTDSTASWNVYHRGLNGGTNPEQYGINLNSTGAEFASSGYWNNTAPTSTEFTVGTSGNANASGGTYVAYLFAHNDGDGEFGPTGDQDIIKCGSYTGNGSNDGPEIDLGFEPQFVITKNTTASANWNLYDSMRGMGVGVVGGYLDPNTSDAEGSHQRLAAQPTGFKLQNTSTEVNSSGHNFIYIAIRRGPMAVPTDATEVFAIDTWGGGAPAFTSNFPVDMSIFKGTGGSNSINTARLIQGKGLYADTTGAEVGVSYAEFDYMDGWNSDTTTNSAFYSWMWKRAPSFCDVVAYTGNGTAGRTVSHNLGVAPEMMWVKRRNTTGAWAVYHKGLNGGTDPEDYYLTLTTNAETTGSYWNNTAPTDSVITFNGGSITNASGSTYIAYLFASLDGVSKVGSYTGTGSTLNIDCGFSSGARFVMIKRADGTGSWEVWDTERGIVSGSEGFLRLNNNNAEGTSDWLDPYSSGFQVSALGPNTSGGTYIFYAIA